MTGAERGGCAPPAIAATRSILDSGRFFNGKAPARPQDTSSHAWAV
jgi:hypothetical protein